MAVSWGRQLGTVIGGTLAGPCGAIIGGLGGSFLSQKVTMDDPVRDALAGVIGEGAGALLGRLTPTEQKRVNHDLQEAFRDAFCEALYDIGGEACFASEWGDGGRDVPREVVFSRSAGGYLWHRNDPLAEQVSDFLCGLVQAVQDGRLLPFEPSKPAANVERYLNCETPQALSDEFFKELLLPYLKTHQTLFVEVRAFGPHLRRFLLDRTLVHLGEHLKQRTEAWRAFNRMVLEEVRFTVQRLEADREFLRAGLTVVKVDQQQLGSQLRQANRDLDDLINHRVPALSDGVSMLFAVMGGVEKRVDEGFERLTGLMVASQESLREQFALTRRDIDALPEAIRKIVQQELAKQLLLQDHTIRRSLPPVPKPPRQLVRRDDELERLFSLLLADEAAVVALSGGAGFGKTTLAQAFCNDRRVKEAFAGGILWVTIGQAPNMVELLSSVIQSLAPGESRYSDLNAATMRLSGLLGEVGQKRRLLVLDDVWNESHIKPFVEARDSSYLMTTRLHTSSMNKWSLPGAVQTLEVGKMTTDQATRMLINWLHPLPRLFLQAEGQKSLRALAILLGEWPLLLELVGAQLGDYVLRYQKSLPEALLIIRDMLKKRGLKAVNRVDEGSRNQAIHISFELSLQQLDKHCGMWAGDAQSWRKRYVELAIFAEDLEIPFAVICKLWRKTANFSEWESEEALFAMQRLSLFTRYDAQAQTVRLHDMIRALLAEMSEKLPALHGQLLTSYAPVPTSLPAKAADWAHLAPDERYMWHYLAYHLHGAQRFDELRALCLSFEFLQAKLKVTDVNGLLADYVWLAEHDAEVARVGQALRHMGHILADDGGYLAGQLVARLMAEEDEAIKQLVDEANQALGVPALRPLRASLEEKEKYQRTFADHISGVKQVAIWGRFGVSASSDKRLKVWDMPNGQELYTLRGHEARVSAVALCEGEVISADWAGMLALWELASGQLVRKWQAHEGGINDVVVRNGVITSVSEDNTIKRWDLASGALRSSWQIHDEAVLAVAVNERFGITSDWDEALLLWDVVSGQVLSSLEGHDDLVTGLDMNDRVAISASHDGTLKVWDLEQAICIRTLRGHRKSVNAVATGQKLAVSVSADKTLKVWDLERGTCLTSFHLDEELNACHLVDGMVMAGGESGRVHLFRLEVGD